MTKGYTFFLFTEAEQKIRRLEKKPTNDLGFEEFKQLIGIQNLANKYHLLPLLYRIKNLTKKFSREY